MAESVILQWSVQIKYDGRVVGWGLTPDEAQADFFRQLKEKVELHMSEAHRLDDEYGALRRSWPDG